MMATRKAVNGRQKAAHLLISLAACVNNHA
jgi:hypothetical protein